MAESDLVKRQNEIARITDLLDKEKSVSFLRLGDRELRFLIQKSRNEYDPKKDDLINGIGIERAKGILGLTPEFYGRLKEAYESCNYLDTYDLQASNAEMLKDSPLNLPVTQLRPRSAEVSGILPDWTWYKFKDYLKDRKVIFYGGEATLLKEMLKDPAYRKLTSTIWPQEFEAFFFQPQWVGNELGTHLDEIKSFLLEQIKATRADSIFICLGGAAKILCHEIAKECNVHAFDWGSMMRSLTYCGANGYVPQRADHHVHFLNVPMEIFYPAMKRAYKNEPDHFRLARLQIQLTLDLQRKEHLRSVPIDIHVQSNFDATNENKKQFWTSYKFYKSHLKDFKASAEKKQLVKEFRWWKMKKGIGWDGRMLNFILRVKRSLFHKRSTVISS